MHLTTSFVPKKLRAKAEIFLCKYLSIMCTFNFKYYPSLCEIREYLDFSVSSKVRQLQQHPPPALFMPVKAAGDDVEAKAIDSVQTTPVNPYRRTAKGMEKNTQYYTLKVNLG